MSIKWKIAQFLEIRWWKRYSSKLDENYIPKKQKYWDKVLHSVGETRPKGRKIIDVGCGPSGIYCVLDGNSVVGVDPLLDNYEEEIEFFDPKMYPYVKFRNMPFEDYNDSSKYEIVYCLNAINHFRDMELSIQKLYDLLEKGGTMLLGIDGHRTKFLKWLFRTIHMDLLHPMQHSLEDYVELLERVGFKIEQEANLDPGYIFNYYVVKATK